MSTLRSYKWKRSKHNYRSLVRLTLLRKPQKHSVRSSSSWIVMHSHLMILISPIYDPAPVPHVVKVVSPWCKVKVSFWQKCLCSSQQRWEELVPMHIEYRWILLLPVQCWLYHLQFSLVDFVTARVVDGALGWIVCLLEPSLTSKGLLLVSERWMQQLSSIHAFHFVELVKCSSRKVFRMFLSKHQKVKWSTSLQVPRNKVRSEHC